MSVVPEFKRPISEGKNIPLDDFDLTVAGAIIPIKMMNLIVHHKIHVIVMQNYRMITIHPMDMFQHFSILTLTLPLFLLSDRLQVRVLMIPVSAEPIFGLATILKHASRRTRAIFTNLPLFL